MRNIDSIDWFTGIYEGEGSTFLAVGQSKHPQMITRIGMSDKDIIERIEELWRPIGRCSWTQPSYSSGAKPCHRWTVTKKDDLVVVWDTMWPLLGIRRQQQINNVFKRFQDIRAERGIQMWTPPETMNWKWG